VGRERAKKLGLDAARMSWVEGNAEKLPFEDNTMDSYTIAFGLRNCTHIDAVLRDAFRCEEKRTSRVAFPPAGDFPLWRERACRAYGPLA
jgi:ubiquinone/menaquinone biosynthesis C-methylase UbiE